MIQAFVYKWMHIPTLKWYIGSRTAKGCHPADGYICSSQKVKTMIQTNPSEWHRDIIHVGAPTDIANLENIFLELADAKNDMRSFNQHNGNGKFRFKGGIAQTTEHRAKIAEKLTGITRTAQQKLAQSIARTGTKQPNISKATKGKPKPAVSKAKTGVPQKKVVSRLTDRTEMTLSRFSWWCNGQDNPAHPRFKRDKGVSKTKTVCRLRDRKEMQLGWFIKGEMI